MPLCWLGDEERGVLVRSLQRGVCQSVQQGFYADEQDFTVQLPSSDCSIDDEEGAIVSRLGQQPRFVGVIAKLTSSLHFARPISQRKTIH